MPPLAQHWPKTQGEVQVSQVGPDHPKLQLQTPPE
jgi:hypothetical protein